MLVKLELTNLSLGGDRPLEIWTNKLSLSKLFNHLSYGLYQLGMMS